MTSYEDNIMESDAFKSIEKITTENGFRCEKHTVLTEDGYILGIYRIPGQTNEKTQANKPPILLHHGY